MTQRDQCMTNNELRLMILKLHCTLYKFDLHNPKYRILPLQPIIDKFVAEHRIYTELTDGL